MSHSRFYTGSVHSGRAVSLRRPRRRRSEARTLVGLCLAVTAWSISAGSAGHPDAEPLLALDWSQVPEARLDLGSSSTSDNSAQPALNADAIREFNEMIFGAPTNLASFAPAGSRAPALQTAFLAPPANTPSVPVVRTANLPVQTALVEMDVPVPPANPFRAQPGEKTVVARAPSSTSARASIDGRALAKADAPHEKGFFQKLFGLGASTSGPALAYARTEEEGLDAPRSSAPLRAPFTGEQTAIYDIEARVVTLPNGKRLEAHSGLGERLDDPRSIREKNRGVTPPNVYTLELRKDLFHGVRAIRLNPVDGSKMFGRDGILAHTYMLGPRGDSNGCVSFKNYDEFLNAFLRGEVTRMVVVTSASSMVAQATPRPGT